MDPIRSFIAFSLPEPTLAHLRSFREALREAGLDGLRHVRPETIHLTLRFLGDVDPSRVEAIASAMAEAGSETAPMTLAARGVGVFPGTRGARVVWAGVSGDTRALADFRDRLCRALEPIGFPREKRPFSAHLTLARVRKPLDPKRLVPVLESLAESEAPRFRADTAILFRSEPKPGGAVHVPLRRVPLAG